MRTTSSTVVLVAFSTCVLGHVPVQSRNGTYVPMSPLPYGVRPILPTGATYETKTVTPLPISSPLENEPCESETSPSPPAHTPQSEVHKTTTVIVTIPVSPPSSEAAAIHTPSSSQIWSPSNSFYVIPVLPASSAAPPSPSVAISVTVSTSASQSGTRIIPRPVSVSSLAASVSTLSAVALSMRETASYIPGVIPFSTPGVIPSYTPGVVLPSMTPGIPPVPASSAPIASSSFTTPSQFPTFVITPSAPVSATSTPTIPVAAPSTAVSAVSSAVSSVASEASNAASSIVSVASSALSSIASAASSALSSPVPSAESPSSAPASATSSPRPSSARSTLSTTTPARSSSSTQGTSIPPAPSAGGSSGSLNAKGQERVWWVAFLVPLVMLV